MVTGGGGGVAWTSGPCVTRDLLEIKGVGEGRADRPPTISYARLSFRVEMGVDGELPLLLNVDGLSFLLEKEVGSREALGRSGLEF